MQRTEQGEAQQTIRALRETENRLRTKLRKLEGARRRGWTITDRFQDLDGEVRTRYVDHAIRVKVHKANQMQGMSCKKQSLSILPSGANIGFES